MSDTTEWPHQMDAIADQVTRAGRPLLLAELDDVFGTMNTFQQRVRMGQFVKRGWLVAHRKVAKATARYTVGNADWHAPIRKVNRYTEQPPEAQHARLMALSQHYAEMAQRLVGKCRKVAEDASKTLREMAGEVHGVPRLEEGAA